MTDAGMESPGGALRAARLGRGWSITDAAALVGARPQDLRALEWDRLDLLDAAASARLVDAYVALLESGQPPAAPVATPPPGPGLLRSVLEPVALGAIIVGLAVAGVTAEEVVPSGDSEPTLAPSTESATASSRPASTASPTVERPTIETPPTTSTPAPAPTVEAPAKPQPRTETGSAASSTVPPATATQAPSVPETPPTRPPAQPPSRPPAATPAAQIGGIAASPSGSTITVVWYASSGVREVLVYRRVGNGPERLVYRGRGTQHVDSELQPGRPHRYRVVGIDAQGRRTKGLAVTVQPT